MSQTVIFIVGICVFALVVWGAVMAGGIWFGQLAEPDDVRSPQRPLSPQPKLDGVPGVPDLT